MMLLVAGLMTACQGSWAATNGFRFSDPETQRAFIRALEREGIKHEVRADGAALYSPGDEDRVSAIRMQLLRDRFAPSVHVADPALERRFLDRLERAQVRYAVQERAGKRWITWDDRDSPKVEQARRSLLEAGT